MKKVNITIEIEDNEFIEQNLYHLMRDTLGDSLKDYTVLSNTKKMYDNDTSFKKLVKCVKEAKRARDVYINEHNYKYAKDTK